MRKGNIAVLVAGVLGAIKLLASALGYDIISDEQINIIANGVAAVAAVAAAVMNNLQEKKPEPTKLNDKTFKI